MGQESDQEGDQEGDDERKAYDVVVLALVGGARPGDAARPQQTPGAHGPGAPWSSPATSASSTRSSPTACCCGTARTSSSPTPARTRSVSAPCTREWAPTPPPSPRCALPFLGGAPYEQGDRASRARPYTVVFAAQPSVPGEPQGPHVPAEPARPARPAAPRARGAAEAALQAGRAHHAHRGAAVPEARGRQPGGLPANFRLVYGNMGEVLDRTDLLVTVSSTAALESLHRRIPTVGPHRPRASARRSATTTSSAPAASPPGTSSTPGTEPVPDADGSPGRESWPDGGYETAFDAARGAPREAARRRRPAAPRPVLHARHRARLPARHPRPPPPRPRRRPAARARPPRTRSRARYARSCARRRAAPTGTACSAWRPSSGGWGRAL